MTRFVTLVLEAHRAPSARFQPLASARTAAQFSTRRLQREAALANETHACWRLREVAQARSRRRRFCSCERPDRDPGGRQDTAAWVPVVAARVTTTRCRAGRGTPSRRVPAGHVACLESAQVSALGATWRWRATRCTRCDSSRKRARTRSGGGPLGVRGRRRRRRTHAAGGHERAVTMAVSGPNLVAPLGNFDGR